MEWFERWFGEEYLLVYEHRNIREAEKEVLAIKNILALRENDLVLDLCCGPGRHDNYLVSLGCRVIGLDFSMPMLKIAFEAVPTGKPYPRYIRSDARRLPFKDDTFDVVLNLFTSFGYFDDDENELFIRSIAHILKPGGRYYIDYLNPVKTMRELIPETIREKNGMTIIEARRYNPNIKRVEKTITLRWDNNSQTFLESVRLYTLDEMYGMLRNSGVIIEDVYGSIAREPYSETTDRMILFGSKPYSHA